MRIIRIFLIAFITTISTWSTSAQPVNVYGKLRVDGTQLVDESGRDCILRGVGFGQHHWWFKFYNNSTVEWLRDDWNCNTIRITMGIEDEGGYLEDPSFGMETMKAGVDAAINAGIYVLINWHGHNLFLDEARAFYNEMARTYGEYPNVIYEIFNEPNDETWEQVKSYSIDIISNIRAIDPDNIILVSPTHWAQDLDIVADDPITGYENIMYTGHFYAATHLDWNRDKWNLALGRIPIFVSECGSMEADATDPINHVEWEQWVDWMDTHKISRLLWGIGTNVGYASSTLYPTASWTGGWSESDLTEWGTMTRTLLRQYSEPEPPPPPPPPPPPTNEVSFNLFPNTTGTNILVLIENDPMQTPLNITFYDATGKLIYENSVESNISHIPIGFGKGVYFVNIGRNDTILAEKILVL